jgi:hypothetical protein
MTRFIKIVLVVGLMTILPALLTLSTRPSARDQQTWTGAAQAQPRGPTCGPCGRLKSLKACIACGTSRGFSNAREWCQYYWPCK